MNSNELQMVEILIKGKEKYGYVSVKAEFEAEGTRVDELLRLIDITNKAGLKLTVKIGGCEAISDLNNCLSMEVSGIVAPMIESEFALEKFIESIISNSNESIRASTDFFINVESKNAIHNLDEILSSPSSKLLKGIVVGRSDLTKSYGYGKQEVVSKEICEIVSSTFTKAKSFDLTTIMGGNVGHSSISFIEDLLAKNLLDKIETRNVIIDLSKTKINQLDGIIKNSLLFESQWMKYKAQYYNIIGESYINRSKIILDRIS